MRDVGPPLWVPVEEPAPRLAEVLVSHGWETSAAVFHHYFNPEYAISRGFNEIWVETDHVPVVEGESSEQTTRMATEWLRSPRTPFFFWVHYYDPHEPYLSHPGYTTAGQSDYERFRGELAYADASIAELLSEYGDALAETAIIITGDHGEAFGEHGANFHASSTYDVQVLVPLWLCPIEGQSTGAEPFGAVSLIDVAPTILDWAGVESPPSFMGRSLLTMERAGPSFTQVCGPNPAYAVIAHPWKLIRYVESDVYLLFNVETDPRELVNLIDVFDERAQQLMEILDVWLSLVGAERCP